MRHVSSVVMYIIATINTCQPMFRKLINIFWPIRIQMVATVWRCRLVRGCVRTHWGHTLACPDSALRRWDRRMCIWVSDRWSEERAGTGRHSHHYSRQPGYSYLRLHTHTVKLKHCNAWKSTLHAPAKPVWACIYTFNPLMFDENWRVCFSGTHLYELYYFLFY